MTIEQRKEMFSKDFLTVADIQELLGLDYQTAAKIMRNIKRKSNRLDIRGKIHVQDYLDAFGLPVERYVLESKKEVTNE